MLDLLAMCVRSFVFTALTAVAVTAGIAKAESPEWGSEPGFDGFEAENAVFKICPVSSGDPNKYALCFTANCWTLDGVAYCKCDLKNGESISLPFRYREDGEKKDVCDIFLSSVGNGFTVSTYSPPRQMQKDYDPDKEELGPPMALYDCPGARGFSGDYSAQCDGGLCFNSTSGTDFPGLGHIEVDQIVCSCPPIPNIPIGFQIAGPWLCDPGDPNVDGNCCDTEYQEKFCYVDQVRRTGTELVVSAPTGTASFLAKKLTGELPRFNKCRSVDGWHRTRRGQ
jgi:hypothetical protein